MKTIVQGIGSLMVLGMLAFVRWTMGFEIAVLMALALIYMGMPSSNVED